MPDHELVQALGKLDPAANVTLILPFTPSILLDPTPLLPTIYQSVVALPTSNFYVYLVTPCTADGAQDQLYDILRQNPHANWDVLQRFLAEVYAAMSAGQWACEKVLLGVEVVFAGIGAQGRRLWKESDMVLNLEGYDSLIPADLPSYIPTHSLPPPSIPSSSSIAFTPASASPGPDVVALGGTFDHLHAAHKLLLHLAHFLARRKVIVGVMSDSLLASKAYSAFLQPISERIHTVKEFMHRLEPLTEGPKLNFDIVEILDAYGPTGDDPDIQALVISDETRSGGEAVNILRRERELGELEIWCIGVISAAGSSAPESDSGQGRKVRGRSERGASPKDRLGSGTSTGSGILKGLDEKTLKEVKMGSTAIRKWLSEERARGRD